jgi:hypothetical protein
MIACLQASVSCWRFCRNQWHARTVQLSWGGRRRRELCSASRRSCLLVARPSGCLLPVPHTCLCMLQAEQVARALTFLVASMLRSVSEFRCVCLTFVLVSCRRSRWPGSPRRRMCG